MQPSKYLSFQVCTTSNVVQFLSRVDIKNLITSNIYIYTYSKIINYLRSYYLPPFYVIIRIFVEDTFLHLGQFLKVL